MNEYIKVNLRRNNRPLRVRRQVPDGIELEEADPPTRAVCVVIDSANEITRYRMRRIRQLQGWGPSEFRLRLSVEDGALILRGSDQFTLPEGRYSVRIQIDATKTREHPRILTVKQDSHALLTVDVTTDERDVEVDLTACDPAVEAVLMASIVDERNAAEWLTERFRPTRKACLLNLLASLRARPTTSDSLITLVHDIHRVEDDRAYAKVDRALVTALGRLADHPSKPFYREGRPRAPIHKKLVEFIPDDEIRRLFDADRLLSFRGEGSPSLQVVVAEPPSGLSFTYAEFDLDLGNALQDVVGFVVHTGELLDGKPTNHLDLWKKLKKTNAGKFVYYKLRAA